LKKARTRRKSTSRWKWISLQADFEVELDDYVADFTAHVEQLEAQFVASAVEQVLLSLTEGGKERSLHYSAEMFRLRLAALTGRFNAMTQRALKTTASKLEEELAAVQETAFSHKTPAIKVEVPKGGALGRPHIEGRSAALDIPRSCTRWWLPRQKKAARIRAFVEQEIAAKTAEISARLREEKLAASVAASNEAVHEMLTRAREDLMAQAGADWRDVGYQAPAEAAE
jgi:hypothetical protein